MTLPKVSAGTSLMVQGLGASFSSATALYFGTGLMNSLTSPSVSTQGLELSVHGVLLGLTASGYAVGRALTDEARKAADQLLEGESLSVNRAFDSASKRTVAVSVAIPVVTAIAAHITKAGPEIMAYGAGAWALAQTALTAHGVHSMIKAENWLREKCGMRPF